MNKRKIAFIIMIASILAFSGCIIDNNKEKPVITATAQPSSMIVQFNDMIVGIWVWEENDAKVSYQFNNDGTFKRQDGKKGLNTYMGTWKKAGDTKYELKYHEPSPGYISENLYYNTKMDRLYTDTFQYLTKTG
jgi:hypothetical protein